MEKKTLLIVGLLYYCLLFSQTIPLKNRQPDAKNRYDISDPDNFLQSNNTLKGSSKDWLANESDIYQYTLMKGGYFTIGTNHGKSDSIYDDQCQITFGHPFAISSYPVITVDGHRFNPLEYLYNPDGIVARLADTLKYTVTLINGIKTAFEIYLKTSDRLEIKYAATNSSSSPHTIKLGLLFDAALGKWGDGNLIYNGTFIKNPTIITDKPEKLEIWERAIGQKGVGISLNYFENGPSLINAGNWLEIYNYTPSINTLYDLALLHEWDEVLLSPTQSSAYKVEVALLNPEIVSKFFLRWDIPTSLAIENNMLFPLDINSLLKITHTEKQSNPELTIKMPATEITKTWSSPTTFKLMPNDTINLLPVPVHISEIYDSIVVPITLQLLNGQTILDQITRNILIPAAPFSNDGLTVSIDTVYKNNGFINLLFSVQKDQNQQILTTLAKYNLFFYKDGMPITDFNLEKDSAAGVNKADIIFALDVTGSMSEEISSVKNNIIEFTDSLSARGVDFQLGMVTFLDIIENSYGFTSNVQTFYNQLKAQYAHGGGDYPENSLQALLTASNFAFRPDAKRIIIWITDASFHVNDWATTLTKEQVISQLLINSIQVHCIGNPTEQLNYYDQILLNTGGDFYNINGNFRDILLKVSQIGESPRYVIKYLPTTPITTLATFKVEAHYAGDGGFSTILYNPDLQKRPDIKPSMKIYPNPISSNTNISIIGGYNNPCRIELINPLGQILYTTTIQSENNTIKLPEKSFKNSNISYKALYIRVSILNNKGETIYNQTIKLINP